MFNLMQKGQAPILILVGVLILVLVAGGVYYFGKSQVSKPQTQIPTPIPSLQDIPSVNLSIENESNKIIFIAKTSGNVYMPESDYFNPTGSWEIYHFSNDKWVRIIPSGSCNTSCDTICETGPLSCVAGGPSPTCQLASSEEIFEWEKQYIDYKNKICGTIPHECAYNKKAEAGKYKVLFTYKTTCGEGQLFGDGPLVIEKEFELN